MTDNSARRADQWLRGVEQEWREWYTAHRRGDHRKRDSEKTSDEK